jgi:hypothetical protein
MNVIAGHVSSWSSAVAMPFSDWLACWICFANFGLAPDLHGLERHVVIKVVHHRDVLKRPRVEVRLPLAASVLLPVSMMTFAGCFCEPTSSAAV